MYLYGVKNRLRSRAQYSANCIAVLCATITLVPLNGDITNKQCRADIEL